MENNVVNIRKATVHFMDTEGDDQNHYIRYSANKWTVLLEDQEEPVELCEHLEKMFRESEPKFHQTANKMITPDFHRSMGATEIDTNTFDYPGHKQSLDKYVIRFTYNRMISRWTVQYRSEGIALGLHVFMSYIYEFDDFWRGLFGQVLEKK